MFKKREAEAVFTMTKSPSNRLVPARFRVRAAHVFTLHIINVMIRTFDGIRTFTVKHLHD